MAAKRKKQDVAEWVPTPVRRHARQLLAILVGIVMWFAVPASDPTTRTLIAWVAGAWLFIFLILKMMAGADSDEIRRRAGVEDEGRTAVLIATIAAAVASIVGLIAQMSAAQEMHGADRVLSTVLALLTIFGSWLLVHFVFALHYAHEFYVPGHADSEAMKGMKFSGGDMPDYWDFLYFSLVVGTTFQTSDTEIVSRRMRRLVMVHGLLSFVFNTAVIALTVNIAAQGV
jgi:uncharacterized membrane protein